MKPTALTHTYKVWNHENAVHGPLTYQDLVRWIKKGLVTSETWLFHEEMDLWQKAGEVPELENYFTRKSSPPGEGFGFTPSPGIPIITRDHLRRVKIFAGMDDDQLDRIGHYMEAERVPAQSIVIAQGAPAEAMYIILEGEVRIRLMIAKKETLLTRLGAGDFFAEMALIDHGPRSADVVTNSESLLAKIRASVFHKLVRDIPDLVMPLVWNIGKTLTGRIRADNKRYLEATNFARVTDL